MACNTLPVFPHTFTAGDTVPLITGVIEETDLSGYTVRLRMDRPTTALVKAATIIDAAQGQFTVEFGPTDLVEGLNQVTYVEFDNGSGGVMTGPRFAVNVKRKFE